MSLIIKAARFAAEAHSGISRKYGCGQYINHPMRVAGCVTLLDFATEELIAAAWLHDVVEDNKTISDYQIRSNFGDTVADLVKELTNSEHHSTMSRDEKKSSDRLRLSIVSREAKYIKIIDRLDNLSELHKAGEKFIKDYIKESILLLEAIRVNEQQWASFEQRIWIIIKDLRREIQPK